MEEFIYRKARKEAAKDDPTLDSAERVSDLIGIDKGKLLKIENGEKEPTPEQVKWMIGKYNAPELANYFCTHQCPLGNKKLAITKGSLQELSWQLLSNLHFIDEIEDKIFKIAADGEISSTEKAEFKEMISKIRALAGTAESLEVWAKKNNII